MKAPVSFTLIVPLFLWIPLGASGQAIPKGIPDTPGESPADRTRESVEERYRSLFARTFVASHVGVNTELENGNGIPSLLLEGGIDLPSGDAFYATVGSYFGRRDRNLGEVGAGNGGPRAYLFALGYDLKLARVAPLHRLPEQAYLGMAVGTVAGDEAVLTIELNPKLVVPINRFWSLQAGPRLRQAVTGTAASELHGTSIGFSFGVKRLLGRRERLE